jgi:putative hemolysin
MTSIISPAGYSVRVTREPQDIVAAQRLRYEVFNVELGEGLAASHGRKLDADPFDAQCDHLVITETLTGRVVGTYRLQTGVMASNGLGYYSAQEFDFESYEPLRPEVLELGRACIHAKHRGRAVLDLLWRGIARYASFHQSRYLVGCSSLTSQDPAEGWSLYHRLKTNHLAPPDLRTEPIGDYRMPDPGNTLKDVKPPKLFSAYLNIGAVIAGPPALDRAFRTIDFLTILDVTKLSGTGIRHFFT